MPQSVIVVLANSIKHRQHCVAGKCVNTGRWIRPVSNLQGGELSHQQARVRNPHGTFNVKPLQKARVGLAHHAPLPHQPENYLIDNTAWIQNYSIDIGQLNTLVEVPADLWGTGNRVEYASIVDRTYHVSQSLYLVRVEDLRLYHNADGKRRASFTYENIEYDLAATDPRFDDIVENHLPTSGILCISLGEPYQGYCYKLVATIF
ncbi:hypothetical protein [Vibrio sp. ED002]|uniref:dual OB domain-containing protein n=1 Tax=Vibrio sp. ED002 TaxID=2785123 RepID=UPI00200EFCA8|nr:hypothetical protein [Vibrio sp. ED002]